MSGIVFFLPRYLVKDTRELLDECMETAQESNARLKDSVSDLARSSAALSKAESLLKDSVAKELLIHGKLHDRVVTVRVENDSSGGIPQGTQSTLYCWDGACVFTLTQ